MIRTRFAVLVAGRVRASSVAVPALAARLPRSGILHLTKECSQYTGEAGSFCTVTSSNLKAIPVGTKDVAIDAAAADGSLDTDLVFYTRGANAAFGHARHLRALRSRHGHLRRRNRPIQEVPCQPRSHVPHRWHRPRRTGRRLQLGRAVLVLSKASAGEGSSTAYLVGPFRFGRPAPAGLPLCPVSARFGQGQQRTPENESEPRSIWGHRGVTHRRLTHCVLAEARLGRTVRPTCPEALEAVEVELLGGELDHVAGRERGDQLGAGAERLAQP